MDDFHLLSKLLVEWHTLSTVDDLISKWKPFHKSSEHKSYSFLHILCFNVRGLDSKWVEVCILSKTHHFDIIALGEVGHVDFSLMGAAFSNYKLFYQIGENSHGGVLVMIRNGILATRVACALPNVYIIELAFEQVIYLAIIYAPASKTWQWNDLSPFVTTSCLFMGDFNIDLEHDGEKLDRLLEWMDACSLGPVIPDANTSLRLERTIDYAVVAGVDLAIQTYEGETSSDHKPLFAVLSCDIKENVEGARTVWSVFSLMLSYTADFWEKEWTYSALAITYERFISFLSLLVDRCKRCSLRKLAKPSIPPEIVKLLARSRSLSFKAKRKGDIWLRQEARRLRNLACFELKCFQRVQLDKQLKERNVPAEGSSVFWSKSKRHFRMVSSSLKGFILSNGETIKEPQEMANRTADY